MNPDDYAVLVGIGRYPSLGEDNTPLDLQGPVNDVDALKEWLLSASGGGFVDASRQILEPPTIAADSAAAAKPTADDLEMLLVRLDGIARANKKAGKGLRVGRRLYLFMSGHGFSPERRRGCLFVANAMERLSLNVHATGWLNWMQDAGYFREYVLWLDACMNRISFQQPRDPALPLTVSSEPPAASFAAFAAQRPLKAIELPIEDDGGKVHGAFTWALLEGLRGAAADASGRVTGRSLADWLRNAQSARYTQRDLDDREVAKEPEIVQEDPGLVFARGVTPPRYAVSLSFPELAAGHEARLWSGAPPRVQSEHVIGTAPLALSLVPGLYLVDVPAVALRQGFEVVRPVTVTVADAGPAVIEPSPDAVFKLDVDPGNPAAEVFVIDGRFALLERDSPRLSTPLRSGLFKIKTRIGNAIEQRVVLLDADRLATDAAAASPRALSTVVPLQDTASTHEYHEAARQDALAAARALPAAQGGGLMLLIRTFSGHTSLAPETEPWRGVTVVDSSGRTLIDLEAEGTRALGGDACAWVVRALAPGSYFLRQRTDDGHTMEQSVIVCPGWRTDVYVLRRATPESTVLDPRPHLSAMMSRLGDGIADPARDRMVETARVALADERRVLNAELEQLLLRKFVDPYAGIIGGHLLLVERERDPGRDLSLLNEVVRNLRALVGHGHPDVEALAVQCTDARLRRVGTIIGPPMLLRSWRLLTDAARRRPKLLPSSMWARLQAPTALPPFLAWTTEEATKRVARHALAEAILGPSLHTSPLPSERGLPQARSAASLATGIGAGPWPRGVLARAAALHVPPSALPALADGLKKDA